MPFRQNKETGQVELLLVESAKLIHRGKLYIFPAGGIDPGEDALTATIRETEEEGGVRGKILNSITTTHDHGSR